MVDISNPKDPATKVESAVDDQDAAQKNDSELQSRSGTTIKGPGTPPTKSKTEEERKESRERLKTAFIILAFIVSCLALGLSSLSYSASKRSAIAAEKSAAAAQENVATAKAALEIADRSVRVASDALIASTRPWVGVKGIEPLGKMVPGKPFYVRVKFKNVGNSPGLDVGGNAYFSPVIKAREVKRVPLRDLSVLGLCMLPKPQWSERITGGFILPGEEYMWIDQPTADPMNEITIKLVKGREEDEPVISPEEWQQFRWTIGVGPKDLVKKKTVGLYLVGCINYFDEFKNSHRTNFCFRYERAIGKKDSSFSVCRDGNDAD
jgi:hypothetical protein